MKKTERTALTAAMFAAALNLIPGGNAAPRTAQAADNIPTETRPAETVAYPVYGTIPAWETTVVAAETTVPETIAYPVYGPAPAWTTAPVTETKPVETIAYPVYGPMPAWTTSTTTPQYTPLPQYADIDGDGRIDTFDYLLLRKSISRDADMVECDLNGDGETDIADLVRLQRYLLGGDEPYVTTSEPWMEAVYGPPSWFGENTFTTTIDVSEE